MILPQTDSAAAGSSRPSIISFDPKPHEFTHQRLASAQRRPALAEAGDNRHNEIELHLLKRGSLVYQFGGEQVVFEPGRLVLFWAAWSHQVVRSTGPLEYMAIKIPLTWFLQCQFPADFVNAVLQGRVIVDADAEVRADTRQFERWLQNIQARQPSCHRITQLELEARLLRLAIALPRRAGAERNGRAVSAALGNGQARHVGQMVSFIAQNYTERVTVELISKSVGLHPHYAMSLFHKTFGTTLINCVTQHRISHARRLLSTTDKKMIDVAMTVGFNSISRFNAAFKKECGCSPREYRENRKSADYN